VLSFRDNRPQNERRGARAYFRAIFYDKERGKGSGMASLRSTELSGSMAIYSRLQRAAGTLFPGYLPVMENLGAESPPERFTRK